MPADPERAQAIENNIARTLRYAADEFSSGPDRVASKLAQAATQLDSSDAKEHLSAETITKFRAQIGDLQKQVEDAERKEKADRIERDVKRFLSNLADEIQSNGSQIDSYFERAEARLTKNDVRECLTPESIVAFQAQLAELGAKLGRGAAPVAPAPSPAPAAAAASPASVPAPPPPPAPAAAEDSEEAQRVRSSIDRTLRFAEGDINSPGWRQIESKLGQAATQIDNAAQVLSASTLDAFRARLAALQVKFDANDRTEKAEENEKWVQRLVRDAEAHIDWPDRIGGMLEKVTELLDSSRIQESLSADRIAFYRNEVVRLGGAAGGSQRQKALDDASAALADFESRISDGMFEGLSEYDAGKLWRDTEIPQNKVGYALDRLPADDAAALDIRARLDSLVARRAATYGATRQKDTLARVTKHWEETLAKVAGWESETQDTSVAALGGEFFPRTREAVRTLRAALSGSNLHSPIPDARTEFADDPAIQQIVRDGEEMIERGLTRMAEAFDAILDAAEQMPIPTGEFELRKPSSMAQTAREAFADTQYADARAARAKALDTHWEDTLELARKLTAEYYEKLSAEAAKKWNAIAAAIDAHDDFDPNDASWRGKTVRVNGFYNRMRWDFTGAYSIALWVKNVPIAADFEPHVQAAYDEAAHHARTAIDDHQTWDAVMVVKGTGKLNQRFKKTVKIKGDTVGEIEEWLPVDCVTCKVIALRAGPVAIGTS